MMLYSIQPRSTLKIVYYTALYVVFPLLSQMNVNE